MGRDTFMRTTVQQNKDVFRIPIYAYVPCTADNRHWTIRYSDYDILLESDRGSQVYRCNKLLYLYTSASK